MYKLSTISSGLHYARRSAKQTIPLPVLARNQTKGFGLEISAWPEVGKGTREGSWKKELEEGVGDGTTDRAVDTGKQRSVGWDEVQSSEGRRVKMSQHSSWVVEFSLEIHASVSLYMLTGMQSVT